MDSTYLAQLPIVEGERVSKQQACPMCKAFVGNSLSSRWRCGRKWLALGFDQPNDAPKLTAMGGVSGWLVLRVDNAHILGSAQAKSHGSIWLARFGMLL